MKKFKIFLICLMVLICGTTLFGCKEKDNLDEISKNLTTYEMQIEFDASTNHAKIKQTVDYVNTSSSTLSNVKFHLYPQYFKEGATNLVVSSTKMNEAYPNGMSYSDFSINRLIIAGKDSEISYENDYNGILIAKLSNNLLTNKHVIIDIEFELTLPNCEHRFGYGENTINFANFYPIACVYENNNFVTNPYCANGDPFYSDIANYNVNITLDNEYVVAGCGEKTVLNNENNLKTVNFNAKAVRDFAFVLSKRFEIISDKVNNTLVEYYYYDDPNAELSLKSGVDAIKTFSNLFGNYPYKTFSIVKCNFIYGGMEYPNLIMISDDINNQDDYMNVIIHETAHQWWYGMVGNDQVKYPWLDEALTEYSTVLFYDNNSGYALNHKTIIAADKDNYSLFYSVYKDVLGELDTSMRESTNYNTEPEYTYCTYVKGTLMYESLFQLIGEKNFIKGLKIYFDENKFKNSTPENLISSFESAYNKGLENFFSSWLTGKVVIH